MKTQQSTERTALLSIMALACFTAFSHAAPLLFTLEGTSTLGETVSILFAVDEQMAPDEIQSPGDVYVYRVVGDVLMQGFHPTINRLYANTQIELRLSDAGASVQWRDYWFGLWFVRLQFAQPVFTEFTPLELCQVSGLQEMEVFLGKDHGSGYISEEESTIRMDCEGMPCAPCDGKVTELTLRYNGDQPAVVTVTDKKSLVLADVAVIPGETFTLIGQDKKGTLGTTIKLYVNDAPDGAIHTSCSQPIGPGMTFGSFTVTSGYSRNGGRLCPEDNEPEDPRDCECDGKVTTLTLEYLGPPAEVRIDSKKKKKEVPSDPLWQGTAYSGDWITVVGNDKHGTLGTEITLYVNDGKDTAIHTSCSQPIDVGLSFGSFTVVDGYSLKGGRFCGTEEEAPASDGDT